MKKLIALVSTYGKTKEEIAREVMQKVNQHKKEHPEEWEDTSEPEKDIRRDT